MAVRRTQLCRVVTSHQAPPDYNASPESAMEFCFSAAGCSDPMLGETPTISWSSADTFDTVWLRFCASAIASLV